MTAEDRSEVREMIVSVLQEFHNTNLERDKQTELREKLIYASLNNIDSHLDKLNGKVAAHEETILKNLPHTSAHCVKAEVIQELHDAVIITQGEKAGKAAVSSHKQVTFNNVITIISTLLILASVIISMLLG